MPVGFKIILMERIKGKDHKINIILYYLCSRNIFTNRSVKKLLNQHKRRGVSDLKKSLKIATNSSKHVNTFSGTNHSLSKQEYECKIRNSPCSSSHSVNWSLLDVIT